MPPKRSTSKQPAAKRSSSTTKRPCNGDAPPSTEPPARAAAAAAATSSDAVPQPDGLVRSPRASPDPDRHTGHPPGGEPVDDSDTPEEVIASHVDPAWAPKDLADLDTDVVITADIERDILEYEREIAEWRAAPSKRAAATGGRVVVPHAGGGLSREERLRTCINNPRGRFTFDTLVELALPPEVRKLGSDTVAEEIVKLKRVTLESVALDDSEHLECLDAVSHLYLSDNLLRELVGLENLNHLRVLVINGNRVTSLLPIAGLEELEVLDARDNQIADLEEDGVVVLPMALQRLSLRGNPCFPRDSDPTGAEFQSFVVTIQMTCPDLRHLDDAEVEPIEPDGDEADAEGDDGDGKGAAAAGGAEEEDMVDFDLEEEEARATEADGASAAATGRRPDAARLALPVAGDVCSSVRTMTDDLLVRYQRETEEKLKGLERANDAANIGSRSALRAQEQRQRDEAAVLHSSRPGSSAGIPSARPGSARGPMRRGSTGIAPAPSSMPPERSAVEPEPVDSGVRTLLRPGSASGRSAGVRVSSDASSSVAAGGSLAEAVQRLKAEAAASAPGSASPAAAQDDDSATVRSPARGDEMSDSDDSSEDEAYTGVRPHADTRGRQQELQRELRFAMGHQCNVAVARLHDLWDSGSSSLRQMRDDRDDRLRRARMADIGGPDPADGSSAAYQRALQLITDYTGTVDFDKYREPPAAADDDGPAPAAAQE